MRGTGCADLTVEVFGTVASLPPEARALLAETAELFDSAAWWNVVLSHALPPGAEAAFLVIGTPRQVTALVPMLRTGKTMGSLTTPYTCSYSPQFADELDRPTRIAAMTAFARFVGSAGVVRLDALPAEWDGLADLQVGARRAGRVLLRFNHFGNWFEEVGGLDWSAYMRRRPGALRGTIRRRLRRAEQLAGARFDLFTRPDQMDRAAEIFEAVYGRSWKDAEPFPDFNVALMRTMASRGLLRLGVWSVGAVPVAVQVWVVRAGHAIVLKLAHDEAFKTHSPGTVLTALMLRHLLDDEHVTQIDFGRGDDAYKQGWAAQRRQRIGVLLVNPWRPAGMIALLRHLGGQIRAALPRWMLSR
jgi:CelD/BcsL family acetyltransferase involved in cellulose biosynthesis